MSAGAAGSLALPAVDVDLASGVSGYSFQMSRARSALRGNRLLLCSRKFRHFAEGLV